MEAVPLVGEAGVPAAPGTVLEGYSDELSALPGDTRTFHVSTSLPSYAARIVRLRHGDVRGPGCRVTPVAGLGTQTGQLFSLPRGSSAVFDAPLLPAGATAFTAAFWVLAHRPARPWQGLLTQWDLHAGQRWGLFVGHEHRVVLCVATDAGTLTLAADDVLWRGAWTFVAATMDATTGEAHLYVRRQDEQELHHSALSGIGAVLPADNVAWRMAAYAAAGAPCGFFDGKIASPGVCSRALSAHEVARASHAGLAEAIDLCGLWDCAREVAGERVVDVSGQGHDGRTLNAPTRGVTDQTFAGPDDLRCSAAPRHYNAIEFHSDDLDDARWPVSFSWQVPEDLASGLYAAHLEAAGAEAFLPFVVRAPAGRRAQVCLLAPTFTWQTYLAQRPAYNPHDDGVPACVTTRRAPLHNPWWGSASPKSYYDYTRGAHLVMADLYLVDWLDSEGIPYDCLTDNDLHAEGSATLDGYQVLLLSAHPEYYSAAMLDALEAYLRRGGRLMYLGGNGLFWVTSVAPGRPHLLEVRRSGRMFVDSVLVGMLARPGEHEHAFSGEVGGAWRDRGRAPNRLVGVGMCSQGGWPGTGYTLRVDPDDPRVSFIFAGVEERPIGAYGLNSGGAAGHEFDRFDPALGSPPETIVLATGDTTGHPRWEAMEHLDPGEDRGSAQRFWHCDMIYAPLPSGGAVFSVGSITWTGALSHNGGRNGVARITRNVLTHFLDRGTQAPPAPPPSP